MRIYIIWLLRILILALLFLPVIVPSLERDRIDARLKPVVVFVPRDMLSERSKVVEIERRVKKFFAGRRLVELKFFGQPGMSPLEEFEELGELVAEAKGIVVMCSKPNLWGLGARRFNEQIKLIDAHRNGELFWMAPEKDAANETTPVEYVVLNDVFVPGLSFLGEETKASVEIVGRAIPGQHLPFEVVLRSGEAVLGAKSVDVAADRDGVVNRIVEVPVSFVRAGTQTLTARISGPSAPEPTNQATTTVNVVHSKSTVLHLALGPDWSLRSFRQKLKFWPNLDLVSYYILRDLLSDSSVPSSQLSLIEFPAEKLFGEQLPSFHGVAVQNFPFTNYLNANESKNLLDYVKNGGRLLIQGGPLSFVTTNSSLGGLFPCRQAPQFDTTGSYRWQADPGHFAGGGELFEALNHIETQATLIGCEPLPGALVLATTERGNHPVLLSMPVGKGLVVAVLAGDWHTYFSSISLEHEGDRLRRVVNANAVEEVFHWLVEFLERRQDVGLRAPDLLGPRLYAGDRVVAVRSRGIAQKGVGIRLMEDDRAVSSGPLGWLSFLKMEVVRLSNAPSELEPSPGDTVVFRNLHLDFSGSTAAYKRTTTWPVFAGTARAFEALPSPLPFAGLPMLETHNEAGRSETLQGGREFVPLLEVFPFLLGLLLGVLALEQYLVHIRWRGSLEKDPEE